MWAQYGENKRMQIGLGESWYPIIEEIEGYHDVNVLVNGASKRAVFLEDKWEWKED